MTFKKCIACGETKELTEYYKHKAMSDGHLNKCKLCCNLYSKKYAERNRDKVNAHKRKYAENNKEKVILSKRTYYLNNYDGLLKRYKQRCKDEPDRMNGYKKKYIHNNPIKHEAHNIVSYAIRKGDLVKPPSCECCGVFTDRLHAHHSDYSKPLDVDWFCPKCHSDWHAKFKAING